VRSIRESEADLICVLIDVDNFKVVNDCLGHAVGDELLVLLAGLIRGCVRHDDIVVRFGGDEIVVLMPGCTVERAGQVASQLIALFRQQVGVILSKSIACGLSIGVVSLRRDGAETGRQLIEKADARLYAAKRSGKGQVAGC
ncbi:MAG: GGDEF domain-containing protein, partial [Phycisphaeraceae bacterium]